MALQKSIHCTSLSSSPGYYAWGRFQEQFCELAAGNAQAAGAKHLMSASTSPFSQYGDCAEIPHIPFCP